MLTTIPFAGFYNSVHDGEIDFAQEHMFSDDSGEANEGLAMRLWDACNWGKVHAAYAADYCEAFAREFAIPSLKFESMKSPREYNFGTDIIYATISRKDARRIRKAVPADKLAEVVRETFTSRSGFMSYYSPDLSTWGSVDKWDHNQLGTLLQVYAEQETRQSRSDGFDSWAELDLMEDARCNGALDGWIDAATPSDVMQRLYRVHEYLRARANRS